MFTRVTPFLLFAAFMLLLLVTLSAPIIDPIYLFKLAVHAGGSGANASAAVQFGVFGYCVSHVEASFFVFGRGGKGRCSNPRLGYTLDSTVTGVLGVDNIAEAVTRATTAALVLNPVATGLTFLAFVASLFMLRRNTVHGSGRHSTTVVKTKRTSRIASFITFGASIPAAIIATIAFIINIVVVAVVRNRVHGITNDISFYWGNAVWMTLGAVVGLWISIIGSFWGVCCGGTRSRNKEVNHY